MFNTDYTFRGKHAQMVTELTSSFDKQKNSFFNRNLDVYLLAPIVGFLFNKKSDLDQSNHSTKIFYEALSKEETTLWFIYRLIILLDKDHEPDFDERVEKAFRYYGTENAKIDEELFEAYVRGGVEVIHHRLISNSTTSEVYFENLVNFIDEIDNLYGQNTTEILNLVELAKDF